MSQNLTGAQIVARDADNKVISWLFHVVDKNDNHHYWSTKDISAGNVTKFDIGIIGMPVVHFNAGDDDRAYTFKIVNFKGITVSRSNSENNMVMPDEVEFGVLNSDAAETAADFIGGYVLISLRIAGDGIDRVIRRWRFDIKSSYESDNIITMKGQSFIEKFLRGKYPNTKRVRAIPGFKTDASRSRFEIEKDDSEPVVPVIWGTAYIPCFLVNSAADSEEAYLLGHSDINSITLYDIDEVSTPTGYGDTRSVWTNASFTMTGQVLTDTEGDKYIGVQPIIFDTDNDGTNDAMGLWMVGDTPLPINVKYRMFDAALGTRNVNTPAAMCWWLLQAYGVPGKNLNANSFDDANFFYTNNDGTTGGGLWQMVDRGKLLNNMLNHGHATLLVDDAIEFQIKSKTSQTTITKPDVLKAAPQGPTTFKRTVIEYDEFHNGGSMYTRHTDKPQDDPHLSWVEASSELTTGEQYISPEILDLRFFVFDPAAALTGPRRAAQLYYQRKQTRESEIEFITNGKHCDLNPEDVITINETDYGGNYVCVIDEMEFRRDLSIKIKATKYKVTLQDWSDLAAPGLETINDVTKTNAMQLVFAGPQATAPTSGPMPNALPNRLRIGEGTSYVLNDNDATSGPSVRIFKGGTELIRMGELNAFGNYAAASEFGFSVFVDSTNFVNIDPTSGMQISSDKADAIVIEEGGDIKLKSGAANGGLLRLIDHASAYGAVRWEQSASAANHWIAAKIVAFNSFYLGPSSGLVGTGNARLHLGSDPNGDVATQTHLYGTTITVNSDDITYTSSTANKPEIQIKNTNADANSAILKFIKDSSTQADDDSLGRIAFYGDDSAGSETLFALINTFSSDITAGAGGIGARMNLQVGAGTGGTSTLLSLGTYDLAGGVGSIVHINESSVDCDFRVDADASTHAIFVEGSTGKILMGDSVNGNSTRGLTINQSQNDDEILTLKSTTDVSHSMTSVSEADTYGTLLKFSGTAGGLIVRGFSDTDSEGLILDGLIGSTNPTDTTPAVVIRGFKDNGANSASIVADAETVWQVRNSSVNMIQALGSGQIMVGTTGADNTQMDIGITIDQNGEDGEILAFKSTGDVAHGMTVQTDTETYGRFSKATSASGGLLIRAFTDANVNALFLDGIIGDNNPTDTTAAIVMRGLKKDVGGTSETSLADAETSLRIQNSSVVLASFLGSGQVVIGTTGADNTNMDIGITIDQNGEDGEILAFKSSDVAHGMTVQTETETYGLFTKMSPTAGGLHIRGFSDTGTNGGVLIDGIIGNNNPTDSVGAIAFRGYKKDGVGTSVEALGSSETVLRILNSGTLLSTMTGDGSLVLPKTTVVGIKVDPAAPTFGWRDILGEVTVRNTGASKPTLATYRDTLSDYQFAAGDEEFINFHIPHDYVEETDIFLHVHWSHTSTLVTGGSVTFEYEISHAKGHNQAAFGASVGTTFVGTASTTQYQHILTEVQISAAVPDANQIDSNDLEPDSVIICRIDLNANNITSSGAVPDPFIHYVDIHYQSTNLGTKQKAPAFYT